MYDRLDSDDTHVTFDALWEAAESIRGFVGREEILAGDEFTENIKVQSLDGICNKLFLLR